MQSTPHPIVVFDGECAFCNNWIDSLLRFDRRELFRFTARQSTSGAQICRAAGLPVTGIGSIVLVENGRVLLRSEAVLRMLALLGFPFSLTGVFRLIPLRLRDVVYDWIARNRTRWFGKLSKCRVPTAAESHRFV